MVEYKADRKVIEAYFEFRKLRQPPQIDALLFLISEVGELVQAFLQLSDIADNGPVGVRVTSRDYAVFSQAIRAKSRADECLSRRRGYVRNNESQALPNIMGEIADVYMMIDRVADSLGLPEPSILLANKMVQKGFKMEVPNE